MRIHGRSPSNSFTRQFTLPRPDGTALTFTMRPLPLSFHRRLRDRGLIPPQPPTRIARDSQGKPIRDEAGLAVTLADERDPQFLTALEFYHQRIAVLAVAESLSADPNITFETTPPASTATSVQDTAWATYADALYAELEQAGFTSGDLIRLCSAACRLSNLIDDHLQLTQANFSSPPPPDTA